MFEKLQKKEKTEASATPVAEAGVEGVSEEKRPSLLDDFVKAIGDSSLDVDQVLSLILAKARRATASEAGSIFIVRPVSGKPKELRACSLQNDRISFEGEPFTIEINTYSIAGYVATTGEIVQVDDLYEIPPDMPYTFNRAFDDKHGYRSKSMLAFPLKNFQGRVIGVVQLLNHINGVDEEGNPTYHPFNISHVEDMKSLLTVLGVMVERIDLLNEIEKLREKLEEKDRKW